MTVLVKVASVPSPYFEENLTADPVHPGVYIDLRRPGSECDMPLALVEFSADDTDFPDGEKNIITCVWGNSSNESYTMRAGHQNIEAFVPWGEQDTQPIQHRIMWAAHTNRCIAPADIALLPTLKN